eukprot:CAMPEP_0198121212 /NCGR_PEP_ID=MMETSP1442-20131203/31476_1 /TAXON_ID= /ORGANISM="Craspedostauros australis, Strain CCMP3328" /LENGTH=180 /DNA_ID=CAMNT_0043779983 /DNA_START=104 /DNA_END=646 /DNA_ORIENTATION=+
MKSRLLQIASAENCDGVEEEQLDTILRVAEGDMRRAVMTLQSVHALVKGRQQRRQQQEQPATDAPLITNEEICELVGLPPPSIADELWTAMKSEQFDTMQRAVEDVCLSGYSAQAVLGLLLDRMLDPNDDTNELSELGRSKMAIRIAQAEKSMIDGADEYLQLVTVCGLGLKCFQEHQKS